MPSFAEGDRVLRLEARGSRGATIMAVEDEGGSAVYRLAYDEGGEGWWPKDALEAEPA
jgi:hypothetical protein